MKIFQIVILSIIILLFAGCACRGNPDPTLRKANSTILPGSMTGPTGKSLPIVNAYRRLPGCYIACYSHNALGSSYSVGNRIFVKGLVRINGLYLDRNCQPQGYFFKDISVEPYFKKICNTHLNNCHGDCWAGTDTGGFLGIVQ